MVLTGLTIVSFSRTSTIHHPSTPWISADLLYCRCYSHYILQPRQRIESATRTTLGYLRTSQIHLHLCPDARPTDRAENRETLLFFIFSPRPPPVIDPTAWNLDISDTASGSSFHHTEHPGVIRRVHRDTYSRGCSPPVHGSTKP